jgi:hypothetical protein
MTNRKSKMRNHRSQPHSRRWRSGLLAAGLAAAALGTLPAVASAAPSDLSLTFTGQTGTSSWSAGGITVNANASTTDPTNPVQKIVCSVDQGASTTTIGAQQKVPVSGNGAHIVECYPVAWDGTQGDPAFTTVQIDDQVPAVTLSGAATSPTWNTGSATVTATASEPQALAGIQSVTCLDGAGDRTVTPGDTGSITVSGTLRYNVSCYATTAAGVIGSRTSEQVWMDNTAPQVTYTSAPDPTQWYNSGQPVQVNVQTPVGAAPIQSLTCDYAGHAFFSGGQLTIPAPPALHNWSVAVTLPGTGSGALNCFAADTAANFGAATSIAQKVDTTPPTGVFVGNPTDPAVILAKVGDNLSGVYGANIQYEQKHAWITLPTTLRGGTARAVIPANNPITVGKHPLRIVVTDNADNKYVGQETQHAKLAILDYPVAAGLRLLYTIAPAGRDIFGHPAANTDTNSTIRLAYGQAAVISGRLDTTARSLLAHQPVGITVRLATGKHYIAFVRTNTRGAWRYRLPAGGDRTVTMAYRGTVGLRRRSHTITVLGHAAIKLSVNPLVAGGQLSLNAQVLGGALPAKGLGLIAQWRRGANSPWQTFPRLQTAADGRVTGRFLVPAVTRGSHIQIRVSAPAARGWGYAGAISPILNARVA